MNVIISDLHVRKHFLPLSFLRPVSTSRIGILTIDEKWQNLACSVSWLTENYIQQAYPSVLTDDNFLVSAKVIPNLSLLNEMKKLKFGESLYVGDQFIVGRFSKEDAINWTPGGVANKKELTATIHFIESLTDIFKLTPTEIVNDIKLISPQTVSREKLVMSGNKQIGDYPVYFDGDVQTFDVTFNTTEGPIYIGNQAQIMEGVKLRGPLNISNHAAVKMSSKIYGGTSIGPFCKVGGEISNVVFQSYSNKGHDGFLGNSVVGEWCNLGADTNSSNLKNNYADVKLWSYQSNRFENTGEKFCGLIMGDHSKCGINSMFNTGTVVGIGANIFGSGFPRNFIPSFAWGGASGFTTFQLNKFFETAALMMKRRNQILSEDQKEIIKFVFDQSKTNRYWEK